MDNTLEIPESFYCPITLVIMEDPVIDKDGNSFERKAIESWLREHKASPLTRNPMTLSDLRPNRALQESIELLAKQINLKSVPPLRKKAEVAPSGSTVPREYTPLSLSVTADASHAVATILPSNNLPRTPCDICCVVDTSGSMGSEATLKTASSVTESHGLSVMDVVKHAVKTIVHSLDGDDRLAVVTFSSVAKITSKLVPMNSQGKKSVLDSLETLDPDGNTNIWDGLSKGMDVLRLGNGNQGRNCAILLLTDGEPNVVPPRGHVKMLQKYKDEHKQFNCTIFTFGFGYTLDSQLLQDIAVEGNGSYGFIPDSSFVGTIFINSLSNLLTTTATNVSLLLEPCNGAKILEVVGYSHQLPTQTNSSAPVTIPLGPVRCGQTKDVVLAMSFPPTTNTTTSTSNNETQNYLQATLKYSPLHGTSHDPVKLVAVGVEQKSTSSIEKHKLRCEFVNVIRSTMSNMNLGKTGKAKEVIVQFIEKIQQSSVASDPAIVDMAKDLSGQALEAVSKEEFYTKWGRHYLPSLASAHLHQQSNNFKDPGVQHYGGELFMKLRDHIDDLFCKLPPPKPSYYGGIPANSAGSRVGGSSGGRSGHSAPPSITSMSTYHSYSNPCFSGDSLVHMADGTLRHVDSVKKGDLVQSLSGTAAILCVVKTHCHNNMASMVQLKSGLLVTPWHPVRINGEWKFPIELGSAEIRDCPAVYSFLLDSSHIMIINGVDCVTLAHGFKDPVVSHPYFGSEKVVEDLTHMRGWDSGLIELDSTNCVQRDSDTGLVCHLCQL